MAADATSESEDAQRTHALTKAELKANGASQLFVDFYFEAPPDSSVRRQLRGESAETHTANPATGGSFFVYLWNGDTKWALRYADETNLPVLEEVAGMTRTETFE